MGAASIRVPSVRNLAPEEREAAQEIARRLASTHVRVWIVGGAVRDLARGEVPGDTDLTSEATPDRIESVFGRCVSVGRAFGTVIVPIGGVQIEHTTFRSESSYSDGRRPDSVSFSNDLDDDAARRDFTMNALYLDPLTDELRDPTGGMDDLRAGRLRCIGQPEERFREDGLRLLRLARFAGACGLEVEDELLERTRRAAAFLANVSPERVLNEFARIFGRSGSDRSMRVLARTDLLRQLFAGWDAAQPAWLDRFRSGAAGALGTELGIALLLWPASEELQPLSEARLASLRPSRRLRARVIASWRIARAIEGWLPQIAPEGGPVGEVRAAAVLLARDPAWGEAVRGLAAAGELSADDRSRLKGLDAFLASLKPEELRPAPLVTSTELQEAGVEPGPRWGELLAGAERAQLAGEIGTREEAHAWLLRQLPRN